MLSAKELFQFRHGLENTIPEKGGAKDFMPQGTWLENKRLEKFHEETEQVLAEPRIQRKCDWVKGTWMPNKQLVELHHEMRNFWQHMGFVSRGGKWLYPEEALFLVETNVLEVWYRGVPLSVQEAHTLILGATIREELYQVYCHLRRIGYVVLRHQGRFDITQYERKIGLDKYKDKTKKHKDKKTIKEPEAAHRERAQDSRPSNQKQNTESDRKALSDKDITKKEDTESELVEQSSDLIVAGTTLPEPPACSSSVVEKHSDDVETRKDSCIVDNERPGGFWSHNASDICCNVENTETNRNNVIGISLWNFEEIVFPDFGIPSHTVVIESPCNCPLLGSFELLEYEYKFDRKSWINKKREKKKDKREGKTLKFSYADKMGAVFGGRDTCKNWAEFKVRKQKEGRQRVVPHLYKGSISPLVKPESATSTASVLDQLFLVQECKDDKRTTVPAIMPDFDVYLPNVKFKKSRPGLPDHRVCVARCSDSPPGLDVVTAISSYLGDGIPIHWAVVDSGEIAFFNIADFNLPTDITIG